MNKDASLESGLVAMKVTINNLGLWTKTCAITIAYFLTMGFE